MPAPTVDEVAESAQRAAARIAGLVRETPLDYSPRISEECAAEVWFKLENLQHTGSFKLRGAANRLMTLTPEQRSAGCVAASSGNHGAAVAYAMGKLNVSGIIFVPEQTTPTKVDAAEHWWRSFHYLSDSQGDRREGTGGDGAHRCAHGHGWCVRGGKVSPRRAVPTGGIGRRS